MFKRIQDWLIRIRYIAIGLVMIIVVPNLALIISDILHIEQRWLVVMTFIFVLIPLTQYVIMTKHLMTLKDLYDFLARLTLKDFLLFAVIEEVMFRLLLLYYILFPQMDETIAIFLSSATFGVYHFDRYFFYSVYGKRLQIILTLYYIVATSAIGLGLAWLFMQLVHFSIFIAFITVSSIHGIFNLIMVKLLKSKKYLLLPICLIRRVIGFVGGNPLSRS